jgi:putative DNA methylase
VQARYIEELFPVKEVSLESADEKNIHNGHIATLHIWWARKPLASSRATNYASLIPSPRDEREKNRRKQFIIELSKWKNISNQTILKQAQKEILETNDGKPVRVLDPFSGGGSIPLEALRLGCETYATDYNPVAVLIGKATLEYPQKFGEKLTIDIQKWGQFVEDEAKKEIGHFYPKEKATNDGYFKSPKDEIYSVGYIWTRTITCQNPVCNAQIPLMRQFWLSRNEKKKVSLYPKVVNREISFILVGNGYKKVPSSFNPDKGTISRAIATCLICGSVVDDKTTRKLFKEGKTDEKLIAVVLFEKGVKGKKYRLSTPEDISILKKTQKYLQQKRESLLKKWGLEPIPDEPTPEGKGSGAERAFSIASYGMSTWGDLFNARQKLTLVTFIEKIRIAYEKMIQNGYELEYAKAVVTYLTFSFSKLCDFNSRLSRWANHREKSVATFSRPILSMMMDYCEANPFGDSSGSWKGLLKWITNSISTCYTISNVGFVNQSTATSLPFQDQFFDAVFTDPPYYDNIPYSYLSDFFYVWMKRAVGDLYPDLFSTPLSPKSKEIVAYSNIEGGFTAGKKFFEDMLKKSLQEISRVLKPNGISYIVYAHKSTAGWETLINSVLDSGLVVTAAWPIHTERKSRQRGQESAALSSSIYLVAKKYQKQDIGFYRDIKRGLREHLSLELNKLWREGVSGADFFVSAIGSAIEVFGRFKKIIDDEGNIIRADKLLEQIRKIVTDYAVKQVLHNGFASEITQMTRFYLLWRWAYGEKSVHFDDARKLAQSVGLDLTHNWNKAFIQKDKEFIRILGPSDRNTEDLKDSNELIDTLHRVLLLWNNGQNNEVLDVLQQSGLGKNDTFYRIAQAISESLPIESKEKKWLDGFLAGKARISKQIKVETGQRRLFE